MSRRFAIWTTFECFTIASFALRPDFNSDGKIDASDLFGTAWDVYYLPATLIERFRELTFGAIFDYQWMKGDPALLITTLAAWVILGVMLGTVVERLFFSPSNDDDSF